MTAITMKLIGDKKLARKFDKMPKRVQGRTVRRGLRAGAKLIQASALRLVPEDTGALAGTIKVRSGRRRRGRINMIIVTGTRDELGIDSADPYYYPAVVEYGSEARNIPPTPFMADAADEKGQAAINRASRVMQLEIRREFTKGRTRA